MMLISSGVDGRGMAKQKTNAEERHAEHSGAGCHNRKSDMQSGLSVMHQTINSRLYIYVRVKWKLLNCLSRAAADIYTYTRINWRLLSCSSRVVTDIYIRAKWMRGWATHMSRQENSCLTKKRQRPLERTVSASIEIIEFEKVV